MFRKRIDTIFDDLLGKIQVLEKSVFESLPPVFKDVTRIFRRMTSSGHKIVAK